MEYFQRFEPISAGDALKRAPGVSFSSDLLEYDFLQLRGLPAIYALVQINGQQMTGGGNDRVFAVDRIPAELIDSVEIIRSPSADMSSEQIAGAANINLKRAARSRAVGCAAAALASKAMNCVAQDRSATATLSATRLTCSTSMSSSAVTEGQICQRLRTQSGVDPEAVVDQNDTRDGTDYAFNGEVAQKLGDGLLRLYGFYVYTDREETEFTQTFDSDAFFNRDGLEQIENQVEDIQQQNLNIVSDYTVPVGRDQAQILFGYNLFRNDLNTNEDSTEIGDPTEIQIEDIDTTDQDWFGTLAYTANLSSLVSIKFGVDGASRHVTSVRLSSLPKSVILWSKSRVSAYSISKSGAPIPTSRQIGTFSRT